MRFILTLILTFMMTASTASAQEVLCHQRHIFDTAATNYAIEFNGGQNIVVQGQADHPDWVQSTSWGLTFPPQNGNYTVGWDFTIVEQQPWKHEGGIYARVDFVTGLVRVLFTWPCEATLAYFFVAVDGVVPNLVFMAGSFDDI